MEAKISTIKTCEFLLKHQVQYNTKLNSKPSLGPNSTQKLSKKRNTYENDYLGSFEYPKRIIKAKILKLKISKFLLKHQIDLSN